MDWEKVETLERSRGAPGEVCGTRSWPERGAVVWGLGDGAVTVGRTAVVEVEWEVSGDLRNHMQTCLPRGC